MMRLRMSWLLLGMALPSLVSAQNYADPEPVVGPGGDQRESVIEPHLPPPGEDVMRPTERGLRLNRRMANGMTTMWLANDSFWRDLNLNDDQQRQLADAASRRMMDMSRSDGKEYRDAVESLFEALIGSAGQINKLSADQARELGPKLLPLARGGKEFFAGLMDDARPTLSKEQLEQLQQLVDKQVKKLDKFEQRLQGWGDGTYQPGENPFDELDDRPADDQPGDSKQTQQRRQARRVAEWDVRRLCGWEWNQLLDGIGLMFKFDAPQRAKGEEILAKYRKKADAIMTPQWRSRLMNNRMQYNAQWQLGNLPRGPWIRHLESEYSQATKPLHELTESFVKELLALPTAEQRSAAVGTVKGVAEKNGLAFADSDMALLWLSPK